MCREPDIAVLNIGVRNAPIPDVRHTTIEPPHSNPERALGSVDSVSGQCPTADLAQMG
jgi:hypothetical protein